MKKTMIWFAAVFFIFSGVCAAAQPDGRLTFTITPAVKAGSKQVDLWVPYPLSDEFQTISGMTVTGNFKTQAIYRDPGSEAVYLHLSWENPAEQPLCTMAFHIRQKDRRNPDIREVPGAYPEIVARYLASTPFVPADHPDLKKIALAAVQGKTGTLEKAKAVYDWVVENTFRDPSVKGCGLGAPDVTLQQDNGGGKCADLSAVFVTLARAVGIPARDVYGVRLAEPKDGDVTSGFHCWAEFYLPGTGWVMVDPADVRKMMLVHKLELTDKDTDAWRDFFWGGDDLFRLVLEKNSRGVVLDGAQDPVPYFMYPAGKVDGRLLDYFDAAAFSYKVTFKAD